MFLIRLKIESVVTDMNLLQDQRGQLVLTIVKIQKQLFDGVMKINITRKNRFNSKRFNSSVKVHVN